MENWTCVLDFMVSCGADGIGRHCKLYVSMLNTIALGGLVSVGKTKYNGKEWQQLIFRLWDSSLVVLLLHSVLVRYGQVWTFTNLTMFDEDQRFRSKFCVVVVVQRLGGGITMHKMATCNNNHILH